MSTEKLYSKLNYLQFLSFCIHFLIIIVQEFYDVRVKRSKSSLCMHKEDCGNCEYNFVGFVRVTKTVVVQTL